ncbi:SLAM family member 7 isoform X2 [Cervus canadensis]|uniref:SLAM family member 7 isoform X2 n=1 Tax=Cervus canadensis TaxID=1574408 RepID=UPI001C9E89C3|nr:SLAM family member 7 isoform X2 [Cervus canadensis]
MIGAPTCVIFLLCQLTGPAASGIPKKLVGAIGGSVIFPLNLSVNLVDSIIWVFNSTTLITIQPKMGDKKALIIVTQKRNKERVNFPHEGYSLKLSRLKKNDSGIYRVEIHSSTLQDPLTQEYELRVYEYLSKPKVVIGLQDNKNGTCVTNLTCSMEHGEEDVTYSWKSLDQATNESHSGSILPISWRWEKSDMTFICMASNPISSNSSNPIFAQNLCEELIEEKKETDTHQETLSLPPVSEEVSEYDTISYCNKTISEENLANTIYSTVHISPKITEPHSLPMASDTPGSSTCKNVV